MHDEGITLERLGRAYRDRLYPAAAAPVADVSVTAWDVGGEPVPFAVAARASYRPFAVGEAWGRPWDTTWFRVEGRVPAVTHPVELVLDLGWRDDSVPGFQ